MARYKSSPIKIISPSPTPDPTEIPPEDEKKGIASSTDGFNLIKLFYDFFTQHDSLMYSTYKKYKILSINRFLDFCFCLIAYTIDTIHNVIVYFMISLIMGITVFSLAKLVGLIDFIINLTTHTH